MGQNLFERAKEFMTELMNKEHHTNDGNSETYDIQPDDREAIEQMIQDAYGEATPEQKKELEKFEQQLNDEFH